MRGLRTTVGGLLAAACVAACSTTPSHHPTADAASSTPASPSPSPASAAPAPAPSPSAAPIVTGAACTHRRTTGDINGDGRGDLVTVATTSGGDTITTSNVLVLKRTAAGFDTSASAAFTDEQVVQTAVPLVGFLDPDCYADVAMTVGRTIVIAYGSRTGLRAGAVRVLDKSAIPLAGYDIERPYAIGDFNGDGRDDLVLEARKGSKAALCVMSGTDHGLAAARTCLTFAQGMDGHVAVGDITGDGIDDLAIGVPSRKVGDDPFAGQVEILYGSRQGLSLHGRQILDPGAPGVLGPPPRPAEFGSAIALGDITGDGHDDLIVGTSESANQDHGRATVSVYRGTSSGITLAGRQLFTLASPGMPGPATPQAGFARSLAAGDFNGDGRADVAIGRDGITFGSTIEAGQVDVLFGTSSGLSTRGARAITAAQTGITVPRSNSELQFGDALSTLPSIDGHADDLVVGVPHNLFAEEGTFNSWVVTVPGGRSGLRPAHAVVVSADQFGVDEIGATFG